MVASRPTVLLVNDDGPPGPDSPYIFGFYQCLVNQLGWDVKVVVPSSQKSWIAASYHILEITRGRYFYPTAPDGVQGETSFVPRDRNDGEVAEWVLLDGTPASCTNISLHNLYPGRIDLVLSGPNFGRNTSSAFSLASGTVGAALSAAVARTRAIALSYGTVDHPTPPELHQYAHNLAIRIVKHLWDNWGRDPGSPRNDEVDLYTVNIPMIPQLASEAGLETYWAPIWRNSYGRLFRALTDSDRDTTSDGEASATTGHLVFKWNPDMRPLLTSDLSKVTVGSDGWALLKGHATVTPLRACLAEAMSGEIGDIPEEPRLFKL